MAPSSSSGSVVTVGGKGGALTSSAVYSVSRGLAGTRIDSAAVEKLSSQTKKSSRLSSLPEAPSADGGGSGRFLTQEEARAALVVLMHKLALSDGSGIRPAIPALVEEAFALDGGHETLDFGSALGFLSSLCRLSGKKVEDVGITAEEIGTLDGSLIAASAGVAAILDSTSSVLTTVLDAVAALSCEAAGADVAAAFDLPASGDGFSVKDETDVAGDMKVILFGSKFTGRLATEHFTGIPAIHASFRSAVRTLHGRTRVELNSLIRSRKKGADPWNHGRETALASLALPIGLAARAAGKCSLGRARSTIAAIGDPGLRSSVSEVFEKNCPDFDALRDGCQVLSTKAANEADDVEVLHEAHELLLTLREILAWEAALALFVIERDESFDKTLSELPHSNVESNGGDAKGDKKSEKKKKKKTLGRGTSVIRQRMLAFANGVPDNSALLGNFAKDFLLYFDPRCASLDDLLRDVKEIVESNEIRRLPKIPKVRFTELVLWEMFVFSSLLWCFVTVNELLFWFD